MNKDYICRIDDDGNVYKVYLDVKTYHKVIKGFDIFVYQKKGFWVCTDTITGACIDNCINGHATKKMAFESAISIYEQYTDDQIRQAHKNALKQLAAGKVDFIN